MYSYLRDIFNSCMSLLDNALYESLMSKFKTFVDLFDRIANLNTSDKDNLSQEISNLINSKQIDKQVILNTLYTASGDNVAHVFDYYNIILNIDGHYTILDAYFDKIRGQNDKSQNLNDFLRSKTKINNKSINIPIAKAFIDDDLIIFKEIFNQILNNDINTSISFNFFTYQILDLACHFGAVNCFKYLLLNGCKITQQSLEQSFIGKNSEIIETCLHNFEPNTICMKNAVKAHVNEIYLHEYYGLELPLYEVILTKNLRAYLYMISTHNESYFPDVVAFSIPELVTHLLSLGFDINSRTSECQFTPLMRACLYSRYDMAKLLVENNASIDLVDIDGKTALMHAVLSGCFDVANLLLDHGADFNIKNNSGRTVISYASRCNDTKLLPKIIKMGGDVNTKNNSGSTPLMYAADFGPIENVLFLINSGAKINEKDDDGRCALYYACKSSRYEVVELLLKSGATSDYSSYFPNNQRLQQIFQAYKQDIK